MRFMRLFRVVVTLILACVFQLHLDIASAERNPASIHEYRHTVWGQKDGAPAGIWAITRTPDGWLWLGTASGLFRFDGVQFERHDLLPNNFLHSRSVADLLTTSSGDLWVFYGFGGASVLHAKDPLHPQWVEGFPASSAAPDGSAEDASGALWVLVHNELYYSTAGNRWTHATRPDLGLPDGELEDIENDSHGNLWLIINGRVYAKLAGASSFKLQETTQNDSAEILAGNDSEVWITDEHDGMHRLVGPDNSRKPLALPLQFASHELIDHQGNRWITLCKNQTICRQHMGDLDETNLYAATDGLESSSGAAGEAMTIYEDYESNIWVGTKQGLEQLHPYSAITVRLPGDPLYFAVVANPDGSIWTGTAAKSGKFRKNLWWHISDTLQPLPGFQHPVSTTLREADGSILLAGNTGAWRFDHDTMRPIDLPPYPGASSEGEAWAQAMVRDSDGRLWFSRKYAAPWCLDKLGWHERCNLPKLPTDMPFVIAPEGKNLWFGYSSNEVVDVQGNSVTRYDAQQGLSTGTVTAILPGSITFVGGERGLQIFDGHRFRNLQAENPDVLTGITGLLRDNDGTLWVNGFLGVARFKGEEVARAIADPSYRMSARTYNESDGVPGGAQQVRPLPTLVRGADGRMWIAAAAGLAWIDPNNISINSTPPPVVINGIVVNDHMLLPKQRMRLSAGTRNLRIDYSALSLVDPERVHFRYRLSGVDEGWQDAGNQREVSYTNLGPGSYRFDLTAANEDGIWNSAGTSLSFSIAPTFAQTPWFIALWVATIGVIVALIFVYRLRAERRIFAGKIAARYAERERIARELHDTFIPGLFGLVLRLESWASDMGIGAKHRVDIHRTVDEAREILIDGRDRIAALRSDDREPISLAPAIQDMSEKISNPQSIRLELIEHNAGLMLPAGIANELLAITREAIANALTHANATIVKVELSSRRHQIKVAISDDGTGIAPECMQERGKKGHWGLVGMRERAIRIGADFTLCSNPGDGTNIVVQLSDRPRPRRPRF